jgi:hypothetical protein
MSAICCIASAPSPNSEPATTPAALQSLHATGGSDIVTRSLLAALALFLLVAGSALAQEYGRTDAGDVKLFAKGARPISGSFSFGQGTGSKFFNAAAGGTLVADRIWFFASAAKTDNTLANRFATATLPAEATRATDAKMMAQLGNRQTLTAALSTARTAAVATDVLPQTRLSATEFSMHYTGIVSPSAFFDVSVSQHRSGATQQ